MSTVATRRVHPIIVGAKQNEGRCALEASEEPSTCKASKSPAQESIVESGTEESPSPELQSDVNYTSKSALENARFDEETGMLDVALIDAKWVMQLEGPIPCRQKLPNRALFQGSVDDESVEVLAVSHPWLTDEHPDPDRWNIKTVIHFLRFFFTLENNARDAFSRPKPSEPPAGRGKRVAIFWDWMSLYQEHGPGGRTEAQDASFKRALKNIDVWYANVHTMVWCLSRLPPDHVHASPRGWCFFETAISELTTPGNRVLDLGLAMDTWGACRTRSLFFADILGDNFAGGGWVAEEDDPTSEHLPTVAATCKRERQFPLPPDVFNEKLKTRIFSKSADAEFVRQQYAKTYRDVLENLTKLNFSSCNLSTGLSSLVPTFDVCGGNLRELDLSKNHKFSGTLMPLWHKCEFLESLKLQGCRAIEGDLLPLGNLLHLKDLNLCDCLGLSGSLEPLETLLNLVNLNVSGCLGLSGNLQPIRKMQQLELLNLYGCGQLTGDLSPLQDLVSLCRLDLGSCMRLIGDLMPLQRLINLRELGLRNCRHLTLHLQSLLCPLLGLRSLLQLDIQDIHMPVNQLGIREFRQTVPDCNVMCSIDGFDRGMIDLELE